MYLSGRARMMLEHKEAVIRADALDFSFAVPRQSAAWHVSVIIVIRSSGFNRRQASIALRAPGSNSGSIGWR